MKATCRCVRLSKESKVQQSHVEDHKVICPQAQEQAFQEAVVRGVRVGFIPDVQRQARAQVQQDPHPPHPARGATGSSRSALSLRSRLSREGRSIADQHPSELGMRQATSGGRGRVRWAQRASTRTNPVAEPI